MQRPARKKRVYGNYIPNNKVRLIRGGKAYFDTLAEMIAQATKTIQLQVYIFDDDETGRLVVNALVDAVKRQVEVYVMADGYASQRLSKAFVQNLENAGIHFRFFEPLFKSRHSYFGRRMHHKIIVIDSSAAMLGGVNISNHYNDMPGQPAWLDFAIHIEGEIVPALNTFCRRIWNGFIITPDSVPIPVKPPPIHIAPGESCALRIRRNDWIRKKNQVSKSYLEMFRKAESGIIMMSGYFLPGRIIRRNLINAAKRGVEIRLILAGISDVAVSKYAERYVYGWLFKNDIRIFEYRPGILHGKVAVYDGQWATIGSYNVNDISAYASLELNVDVNDSRFAGMLQQTLEQIIERDCTEIIEKNFNSQHNFLLRLWEKACYLFIRLLFYLFTLNFKQRP